MSRSIYMIAAPDDYADFIAFCHELGLIVVPPLTTKFGSPEIENPSNGPFCYLSPLPTTELHPYGDPPVRISDATDPLIGFLRPYYTPPYLVDGRLHWHDYPDELAIQTKPFFEKAYRWVRRNWPTKTDTMYWTGPAAAHMLASHSAQRRSCLHGVPVKQVRTGQCDKDS